MPPRQNPECTFDPAKVLRIVRERGATSISDLQKILGIEHGHSTDEIDDIGTLKDILRNLAEAGLIRMEGTAALPTELIAKVQRALGLSLKELSQLRRRNGAFVDPSVIDALRKSTNKRYDLSKVVRFCEELNSSYSAGNYLASTLLIRALLNHVPPVFGHTTFLQVASEAPRPVGVPLKLLEEECRKVADLHTHLTIRCKENLPTRSQLDPFQAGLEVLLQEILTKTHEPD